MPGPQKKQARNLSAAADVARRLVEDQTYLEALKARLLAGDVPPAVEAMLWAYAYGKPVEVVEVSSSDDLRRSFTELGDADFKERGAKILAALERKVLHPEESTTLFNDTPTHGTVQ